MDVRGVVLVPVLLVLAGCQGAPAPRPVVSPPAVVATEPPAPVAVDESPALRTPVTTPSLHLDPVRCTAAGLRLSNGGPLSPGTGQHPLVMTLTNVSSTGCHLDGYPGVALVDDRGSVLPFQYRRGDQMVTSRAPIWVDLAPGASAYVTVNKYRCDTVTVAQTLTVRVIPPGDTTALSMPVGSAVLSYCGAGDPGSLVAVSPVEPTLAATLAVYD